MMTMMMSRRWKKSPNLLDFDYESNKQILYKVVLKAIETAPSFHQPQTNYS